MNIGLLGFGFMGKTHAYAVQNLNFFYRDLPFEAKIAGVCCAHEENARTAVRQFGLGRVYANEDEMFADQSIDVVDICTPNHCHYPTLKKAIAAGKHIYCEKPLCVTYEQAKEIAELASVRGLTAQVVFHNRFLAPVRRAKEIVDEGRLGRILSFHASYLHSSAVDTARAAGWKQDRDYGGGVLLDLGSHAIDLIYYLCGAFTDAVGKAQIAYPARLGVDGKPWQTNAEEAFYLIGTLECGAVGTVEASKIAPGTNDDLRFEIYGEKGALRFDLMNPNYLYYYDGTAPESPLGGMRGFTRIECVGRYPLPGGTFPGAKAPVGWLRGHLGSMYAFLSCVHRGVQATPSFTDGAHVQWVMERAYESAGS